MDLIAQFNADPLPFARTLGIELIVATPERVVGEMTVREELCTRPTVLHGGARMAFADTPGDRTVTIESKTNFVAAAPLQTRLIGEATPVHRGRMTMVWQTRVVTHQGQLVGLTTQTQLVIRGRGDAA